MDLLSIVLTLRPTQAATLPARLGRAAYAILLDRLAGVDPSLTASVHDGDGPKPVTCSDLLGGREQGAVSPEMTYTLRYTALAAPVAAALRAGFTPGDVLVFEGVPMTVEAVVLDPEAQPWTGEDAYDVLAARTMLPAGPGPSSAWTLHFASPVAFKSQGITQPLPLPELVFGSLATRWNAFAPIALPEDEIRRYAAECVAISRYRLRSAPGWHQGRGMRIGSLGEVTYRALNRDRYWLAALSLLAAFARYSGVGVLTTMGMGQTREIDIRQSENR